RVVHGLCETCKNMREVRTSKSRFLLCELSVTHAAYPKYPPQPIMRCDGYQSRDEATDPMQDESPGPLTDPKPSPVMESAHAAADNPGLLGRRPLDHEPAPRSGPGR